MGEQGRAVVRWEIQEQMRNSLSQYLPEEGCLSENGGTGNHCV
jgi:hypothetical protein